MQRGFDVVVVTSRMNTAESYVVDKMKVRCYDSLNVGFGLGIPYSIPSISSLRTFLECVQSSGIIHVHGHPYLSSLIAAKLARRYSKPLVVTQHNTFIKYNSFWDEVEKLNDIVIGKSVLKEADKTIAVSNATRKYVLSLGADARKTVVLHNGVDIERFRPVKDPRAELRRKLGIAPKDTVVLTVRRLVYKNGIDTLIESAKTAIEKNPRLIFLVVGTGPDFDAVQERIAQLEISDRFRLVGFVSDAELPSYYNAADLFVLPSKTGEGLPLVGLEAMSSGLPMVGTSVGGISELMVGGFGRLVPPDMPIAMTEAVLELSQTDLGPVKKQLRTIAEEQFSWDKNVDRLSQIYEELI
jgi:glycosyltransferase involved in cell wall biosynthesis